VTYGLGDAGCCGRAHATSGEETESVYNPVLRGEEREDGGHSEEATSEVQNASMREHVSAPCPPPPRFPVSLTIVAHVVERRERKVSSDGL